MRKKLIQSFLASLALAAPAVVAQEQRGDKTLSAEPREFVIAHFKTESGVTLPEARVVYGTYGKLNDAKDNAVLLPSYYMANFHGYEWLIGPGKALENKAKTQACLIPRFRHMAWQEI